MTWQPSARRAGLAICDAPQLPEGAHHGRVSLPPAALGDFAGALNASTACGGVGEIGIGTVHVAADDRAALAPRARRRGREGGWMLREAGAPDLDGFGSTLPNARPDGAGPRRLRPGRKARTRDGCR